MFRHRLIRFLVTLHLRLRNLFWRKVIANYGGSVGRNVSIYEGVKFFLKRGCPILVGEDTSIQKGVILSTSETGKIVIGRNVYIGEYCVITSNAEIVVGDEVLISPHCDIVDFNHIYKDPNLLINRQGLISRRIVIEEGAWVGSGAKILMGVTVGKGAVVGAGSVVTRDVEPCTVVAGNPARVIRKRNG